MHTFNCQPRRLMHIASRSSPCLLYTSARGRIVCNCLDVSENEIRADLAAGLDLAAMQNQRKCGTNCGSCLPELRRMAAVTATRN